MLISIWRAVAPLDPLLHHFEREPGELVATFLVDAEPCDELEAVTGVTLTTPVRMLCTPLSPWSAAAGARGTR